MYIFCYYLNRRDAMPRLHVTSCRFGNPRNPDSRYTRWSPVYATHFDAVHAMTDLGLPVIPCRHCNP